MATAFWRRREGKSDCIVVRYIDEHGVEKEERRKNDRTVKQAREYAMDMERRADLIRKGLVVEARPVAFGVIWDRWWKFDGSRRRGASNADYRGFLEKHLGHLRPIVVTPGSAASFAAVVDELLAEKEKAGELGPQSLNHLRAGVNRMFEFGKDPKHRLWAGDNPARWVKRRTVPKTHKETLKHHEVAPVLAQLAKPELGAPWLWAAAICLYTNARPGEAFGLHKADVDLARGVLTFRHSWGSPMPKDEEPRTLLIVAELRPHLEAAIAASPSELVLPRADGSCFPDTIRHNLVRMLRGAMGRAGLVVGYEHCCRRCRGNARRAVEAKFSDPAEQRAAMKERASSYSWKHPDAAQRECPTCAMKLWAKALPRPIRFYDLRHTNATILLGAGVGLGIVSKAMGHDDEQLTAGTYDHSLLEQHRAAFERVLKFNGSGPGVGPPGPPKNEAPGARDFSPDDEGFRKSGREDSNLRPLAPQASAQKSRPESLNALSALGVGIRGVVIPGRAPGAPEADAAGKRGGPRGGTDAETPMRARLRRLADRYARGVA